MSHAAIGFAEDPSLARGPCAPWAAGQPYKWHDVHPLIASLLPGAHSSFDEHELLQSLEGTVTDPWLRAAAGLLLVSATLIGGSSIFAALLHHLPILNVWRGVAELAIILATGCAVRPWRLLFARGQSW